MPRALSLLACLGLLTLLGCKRESEPESAEPEPESEPEPELRESGEPESETELREPGEPAPSDSSAPDPAAPPEPDRQALAAAVREQLPTLTSCYEDQLENDRNLRGKILVTITIEAGGWVSEVMIDEDGVGSEAVRACVVERMKTWSFDGIELGEPTELGFAVDFEAS